MKRDTQQTKVSTAVNTKQQRPTQYLNPAYILTYTNLFCT